MHRDGVKAWEPVSDECVHVFHSYSDQPSGSLDTTLGDGLHFKTDQLRTLASVCEDNSQNQDVILENFLPGKKTMFPEFPDHHVQYAVKVSFNIWIGCQENCYSVFVIPFLNVFARLKRKSGARWLLTQTNFYLYLKKY